MVVERNPKVGVSQSLVTAFSGWLVVAVGRPRSVQPEGQQSRHTEGIR